MTFFARTWRSTPGQRVGLNPGVLQSRTSRAFSLCLCSKFFTRSDSSSTTRTFFSCWIDSSDSAAFRRAVNGYVATGGGGVQQEDVTDEKTGDRFVPNSRRCGAKRAR